MRFRVDQSVRDYQPYPTERQAVISLRQVIDLVICLILTVICVRSFIVEGYMISTGSMAPGLLGYHKRVVCPRCQTEFELGVRFEEGQGLVESNPTDPKFCRCPNCDESKIDLSGVPKTQGDQLLVHKNAYFFREPIRWEVVVFRNPRLATEAYVKRVLGCPRERVRILTGDVFINGERARKTLAQCLATELTVYDDSRRPTDSDWKSRWTVGNSWSEQPNGFASTKTDEWSWISYNHLLRSGGSHETSVIVPAEQLAAAKRKFSNGAGSPFVVRNYVEFERSTSRLIANGVVSDELRDLLLSTTSDPTFRQQVQRLQQLSQIAPIQDQYGYNSERKTEAVADIGIELTASGNERTGELVIRLSTPHGLFEVAFNLETGAVQLFGHEQNATVSTGSFQPSTLSKGAKISVRQTDRRIFVVLNNQLLFAPFLIPDGVGAPLAPKPLGFATRGAQLSVTGIRITRDIHYTAGRARNGVNEEFLLGDEEYFVLGDNSPVSDDSRNWKEAAVHRSNLVGKPFLVHLPSSPKALRFGGGNRYLIRLPDFSRIRYIR
ncbi:MAG: S26 family signal peptidase [Planctomycetaceae bacterium]